MKLASYKNGQRDGELMIVSRDLATAYSAAGIADTMQQALDNWQHLAPQLEQRYVQLNQGELEASAFDESRCCSPLPRAYQWADGSAYVNHVELVRRARDASAPREWDAPTHARPPPAPAPRPALRLSTPRPP